MKTELVSYILKSTNKERDGRTGPNIGQKHNLPPMMPKTTRPDGPTWRHNSQVPMAVSMGATHISWENAKVEVMRNTSLIITVRTLDSVPCCWLSRSIFWETPSTRPPRILVTFL